MHRRSDIVGEIIEWSDKTEKLGKKRTNRKSKDGVPNKKFIDSNLNIEISEELNKFLSSMREEFNYYNIASGGRGVYAKGTSMNIKTVNKIRKKVSWHLLSLKKN